MHLFREGVIGTSSAVHFRAAVQYYRGEKMRDSCALFQARESKSIDTMASLVTDTVPGAGKFSLKSMRSKFQDFFFFFFLPRGLIWSTEIPGTNSELAPGLGLGSGAQRYIRWELPYCSGFFHCRRKCRSRGLDISKRYRFWLASVVKEFIGCV